MIRCTECSRICVVVSIFTLTADCSLNYLFSCLQWIWLNFTHLISFAIVVLYSLKKNENKSFVVIVSHLTISVVKSHLTFMMGYIKAELWYFQESVLWLVFTTCMHVLLFAKYNFDIINNWFFYQQLVL